MIAQLSAMSDILVLPSNRWVGQGIHIQLRPCPFVYFLLIHYQPPRTRHTPTFPHSSLSSLTQRSVLKPRSPVRPVGYDSEQIVSPRRTRVDSDSHRVT